MKNVLIVEDDIEINRMLQKYLNEEGYNVFFAFQGMEALSLLKTHNDFSIVLLDLMIPYKSGDQVLTRLREFSDVPVIVISAKDMVQTKVEIIKMGADDYITKPFDLDEVVARMESVLRRSGKIKEDEQEILVYKNMKLNKANREVSVNNSILTLTSKEYEILELLLSHPKKLFSKANLFENVWNEIYYNEDNSLKVHMSNLRNKIKDASPDEEYIETVWGMGYRLYQN